MAGTIERAMDVLAFFSPTRTEIGLSEFQRLLGRDKATTYRHLTALEAAGLLEQNPATRRYRIGPIVLRLAHLREAAVPRRAGSEDALAALAAATGETAHVSLLQGDRLVPLSDHQARVHSTRVVITDDELPLHATGSGLAVLAHADAELLRAARRRLTRYTDRTVADALTLDARIEEARRSGFGESAEGFETGVHGVAAPLFDQSGRVAGAVAVASVAGRMTPDLAARIRAALPAAARAITRNWGGSVPDELERAWSRAPQTADRSARHDENGEERP